jgi:hypothetical protein
VILENALPVQHLFSPNPRCTTLAIKDEAEWDEESNP